MGHLEFPPPSFQTEKSAKTTRMQEINTIEEVQTLLQTESAALLYFTTPECNVCKVLRPKLEALLEEHYLTLQRYTINLEQAPEIAGQYQVFTAPTVAVFLDGREFVRKSRNFSPMELIEELRRPWELMHS